VLAVLLQHQVSCIAVNVYSCVIVQHKRLQLMVKDMLSKVQQMSTKSVKDVEDSDSDDDDGDIDDLERTVRFGEGVCSDVNNLASVSQHLLQPDSQKQVNRY